VDLGHSREGQGVQEVRRPATRLHRWRCSSDAVLVRPPVARAHARRATSGPAGLAADAACHVFACLVGRGTLTGSSTSCQTCSQHTHRAATTAAASAAAARAGACSGACGMRFPAHMQPPISTRPGTKRPSPPPPGALTLPVTGCPMRHPCTATLAWPSSTASRLS
jgi:hypothetical protein